MKKNEIKYDIGSDTSIVFDLQTHEVVKITYKIHISGKKWWEFWKKDGVEDKRIIQIVKRLKGWDGVDDIFIPISKK